MWIEEKVSKTGKTSYKFIERYTCPFSGKLKKISVTYPKKGRQVEKAAYTELQARIYKITHPDVMNNKTLTELIDEFIEYRKPFVKPATNHNHKQLNLIITGLFPDSILISNLTASLIQKILTDFLTDHSYSYTKALFSLTAQSLRYGEQMNYIADVSYLDKIKLPRPLKSVDDVKKEREKFLTKTELTELLAEINKINTSVALICEFQSLTGLRIGELTALRTQDFDRKKQTIDVNGTLTAKYKSTEGPQRVSPKNIYSIRAVSLDQRAMQILHRFIMANNARKLLKSNWNPDNYIFVTDGGQPFETQFINKILKRVNFRKLVSTHTFRHTHISLLAESKVPLKAIMERVGHNDARTTLSIYTHVTDDMTEELKTAITNIGKSIVNK